MFAEYASVFNLKVGHVIGKESFKDEQKNLIQKIYDQYKSNIDILICTPGRLMRHIINTPGLDFSHLQ